MILSLMVVMVTLTVYAAGVMSKWNFDKSHQKVAFTVSHMTISDVVGNFKDVDATITCSKADFSDAVAEMTIKSASINTDDEKRDEHLRNPDFFDTDKYPTITFKSTSFKKGKTPNTYVIGGNLTMHGVTKAVTLAATSKTGTNPYSKQTVAGFKVVGKINRKDFGIAETTPEAILGNSIGITINAEFIKE